MYKGKKITVVVPAYNEERFIRQMLETVPDYIDRVFVVNDASIDNTQDVSMAIASDNRKIIVINLTVNIGVGGAIIAGHKRALREEVDILAVMAGDNQMNPDDLPAFLEPLVDGKADYAKGNRMSNKEHRREMPAFRQFGTYMLTILTRISSGYWHINDPQNGYTAITRNALLKIPLRQVYQGFAFENDMLVHLNIIGAKVIDIPHRAVYCGQVSKIKYPKFIVQTSWMLLSGWIWRLWSKFLKD